MKVTIKGFITLLNPKHAYCGSYDFLLYDITGASFADGRVMIMPHTIEVDIPDDFDPRPHQIAALQADRTKLQAAFSARVTEIERQISELTCLEMS